MEQAAVQGDGLLIPLIDFDKFLSGSPSEKLSTARAILTGFQTAGFVYLKNTPIPPPSLAAAFSASAALFSLSPAQKLQYAWSTPAANRGYSAPGREKVSLLLSAADVAHARSAAPDMKESFEIGREDEAGRPNHWPTEPSLAAFRPTMTAFIAQCNTLQREVMRAIAVGMGLGAGFFDGYISAGDNTMRLLHYPAVSAEVFAVNPGQVRAGEHSDYGSVTLLFQDGRGGLQVRSPNGGFVDATPMEGTVVVNAGDLLARWSNDTIKSTVHRVVEPPRGTEEGEVYPPRYSIAYFCNPDFDQFIEALPGTYAREEDKKYPGVTSGEYLVQRLEATY